MIAEILIIIATVWVVIGLLWYGVFCATVGKNDHDWFTFKLLIGTIVYWPVGVGILLYEHSKRKDK